MIWRDKRVSYSSASEAAYTTLIKQQMIPGRERHSPLFLLKAISCRLEWVSHLERHRKCLESDQRCLNQKSSQDLVADNTANSLLSLYQRFWGILVEFLNRVKFFLQQRSYSFICLHSTKICKYTQWKTDTNLGSKTTYLVVVVFILWQKERRNQKAMWFFFIWYSH